MPYMESFQAAPCPKVVKPGENIVGAEIAAVKELEIVKDQQLELCLSRPEIRRGHRRNRCHY